MNKIMSTLQFVEKILILIITITSFSIGIYLFNEGLFLYGYLSYLLGILCLIYNKLTYLEMKR